MGVENSEHHEHSVDKPSFVPGEATALEAEDIAGGIQSLDNNVGNFLNDQGHVSFEKVETLKSQLSASVLETLNQIEPGILARLFIKVKGDTFIVDFAGNQNANSQIGLSQLLRGNAENMGLGYPLEGIRELKVYEDDVLHENVKRQGFSGNFNFSNGAINEYQEVHSGYRFEITKGDEDIAAKRDAHIAKANKAYERFIEQEPKAFEETAQIWDSSASHLAWNEETGSYSYSQAPTREALIRYVTNEAVFNGLDPDLAIATIEAVSEMKGKDNFEDQLQWIFRSISEHEELYRFHSDAEAKNDAVYTGDFLLFLADNPIGVQTVSVPLNTDTLFSRYSAITGKQIERPQRAVIDHHEHSDSPDHSHEYREIGNLSGIYRLVPNAARMSSGFGPRSRPIAGASSNHGGIDIAARTGSPIHSWKAGKVIGVFRNSRSAGNYVVINHGDGTYSRYLHCSRLLVEKGQMVEAGQRIADVGNTGNSSGPHLHFEIRKGTKRTLNRSTPGRSVNPLLYL